MNKKELEDYIENFRWHTQEGEVLTMDEIKTAHMFNCMKMYYNHLADEIGLPTFWYVQKYDDHHERAKKIPKDMARVVLAFIYVIEQRKKLKTFEVMDPEFPDAGYGRWPNKYDEPYEKIKSVLFSILRQEKIDVTFMIEDKPVIENFLD